jgi:hypothetical protein
MNRRYEPLKEFKTGGIFAGVSVAPKRREMGKTE